MTIKELFEAAVEDGFEDYEIRILHRDRFGYSTETDNDPEIFDVNSDDKYILM